jgi:hypothetical protein
MTGQQDRAIQAPRGVRGGHERDGTDDPFRKLTLDSFSCGDIAEAIQQSCCLQELLCAGRRGDSTMARTYREIAIEEMLRTVEEAMSNVIDWWGDLPPPMKEAIEQFRSQLGAAIDSVEFVKRALDRQIHETERGKGPA